MWHEPSASDSDMPSPTFFHEHRDLGGAQAEALVWAMIAMSDELVQCGFDESKIKGCCRLCYVFFLRLLHLFAFQAFPG